jgi:hypothetical protein
VDPAGQSHAVLPKRPADHGRVVVVVERELGCAVVQIEERAVLRVRSPENLLANVGAFQVLRPWGRKREEPLVKGLKLGSLLRGHLVLRDHDEVHVAVGVGVADGERALEIRAAEAVAENLLDPGHELAQ